MPKNIRKRSARRRRNRNDNPLKPGQLVSTVPYTHTFRFGGAANVSSGAITVIDILGAAGVFTEVANTSVVPWYDTVKVNWIKIWGTGLSVTTNQPSTITLTWSGGQGFSADIVIVDTSTNPTAPPYITSRPPPRSAASFWLASSAANTQQVLSIAATDPIIVDLNVSLQTNGAGAGDTLSVVTAAVGVAYWLALDGPAGNSLVPIGLPSTH